MQKDQDASNPNPDSKKEKYREKCSDVLKAILSKMARTQTKIGSLRTDLTGINITECQTLVEMNIRTS